MKIGGQRLPDGKYVIAYQRGDEPDPGTDVVVEGENLAALLQEVGDKIKSMNENQTASASETDDEKVRRVADEIQALLVKENCAMIPSISLQVMPKAPVVETPPPMQIITP